MILGKNLDLLALQETEKLGETWDDFDVGHTQILVKPAATNGVGFLVAGRLVSAVIDQHVEREFAVLLCNVEGFFTRNPPIGSRESILQYQAKTTYSTEGASHDLACTEWEHNSSTLEQHTQNAEHATHAQATCITQALNSGNHGFKPHALAETSQAHQNTCRLDGTKPHA